MSAEAAGVYRAYLLRLWQVESERGPVWRASLEDVHTGEQRGFEDVEQLCVYLQACAGLQQRHHSGRKEGRD